MTTPSAAADADTSSGASRWTVAIFAMLGLGVGLLTFAFRAPTYESEALVAVSNPAGPLQDEVAMVTGTTVMNAATVTLGFEPDVTVTAAEVASLLTITATADNAQKAANAANTVAATYVQAQLGAAANVAQPATPADGPSGLGLPIFAILGSIVGAIIGATVGYFQGLGRKPKTVDHAPARAGSLLPHDPLSLSTNPKPEPIHEPQPRPAPQTAAAVAPVTPQVERPPEPAPTTSVQPEASPPRRQPAATTGSFFEAATGIAPNPEPTDPDPSGPEQSATEQSDTEQSDTEPGTQPVHQPLVEETWLAHEPLWPTTQSAAALEKLDRRALLTQFETARYELVLNHNEESARKGADHERVVAELRANVANLNKQVRMQQVRLKNRSGTDQTRVGDLEAQTDALEIELAGLRQTLETERIAHTKRITEERGVADRSLDNARRQYREELSKHVHGHRQALADHRAELDNELATDRAKHAAALEAQHVEYERQLETERKRLESKIAASAERQQRELVDLHQTTRQELDRQATQHKQTIEALRGASGNSDTQLRDLEKENRALRAELSTQQKHTRQNEAENDAAMQRLSDEVSIMRGELEGERERNAALRVDVLRRSAESHQAIDRAVEERTAQLAELESSVARQREYADRRVRETSAAAEEQARQAAMREADLTATISRLKREVAEAQKALKQT